MKLKYKCLVLDHDDTVVNSTATIHYPCFLEYVGKYYPHIHFTLEEYFRYNFDPGVISFFKDICGMSEDDLLKEQRYWQEYVKRHVPTAYPGMKEIMEEHRERGGIIAVVSHSYSEYILRDYAANGLPAPDVTFGWELPREQKKPNRWPLDQIMRKFDLSANEMIVIDDLKPGYDMAASAGVPFAAAGWANDIPEIERFMRTNCERYFKTVGELRSFLFD